MKYALLIFIDGSSVIPLCIRYKLYELISIIVYLGATKKRVAVKRNLTLILNKKPTFKETLSVFTEYAHYWAELPDINKIWAKKRKVYEGDQFPPTEEFFLGFTFHLGNFELFGNEMFIRYNRDFKVVAERLKPPFLAEYFKKRRAAHHIESIPHDEVREITKTLLRKKPIGIVCDRMIEGKGLHSKLFGKDVILPLNMASLAFKYKIPICVAYTVNENGCIKICSHMISPELELQQIIQSITSLLETALRKYPYQWHVLSEI